MASIAELKRFVKTHAGGGIGAADAKALVRLAAGKDRQLGAAEKKQLAAVLSSLGDQFTSAGVRLVKDALGGASAATTVGASGEAFKAPRSWKKYEGEAGVRLLKRLEKDSESVAVHLGDAEVNIDAEGLSKLAKTGDLTVYENPKEELGDPDDETGHQDWVTGYHVVVNRSGGLAPIASQLEGLIASAGKLDGDFKKTLEKFHDVVHAARVNGLGGPPDLAKIKPEVKAAVATIESKLAAAQAAQAAWQGKVDTVRASPLEAEQHTLVDAIVKSVTPDAKGAIGMSVQDVHDIVKANAAVYDRPEVYAVDPGFDGVRVIVNTETLVANGGTVEGYEAATVKLLKAQGVKQPVDVQFELRGQDVLAKAVEAVLVPTIGAAAFKQTTAGTSNSGTHYEVFLTPDAMAKGQALMPKLMAALRPYGITDVALVKWTF